MMTANTTASTASVIAAKTIYVLLAGLLPCRLAFADTAHLLRHIQCIIPRNCRFNKRQCRKDVRNDKSYNGVNQIGVIQGIEHKIGVWSDRLTETETDLSAQEAIISSPFAKQAELDAKTSRFNEVMSILNPKDEQVIGDEGDVQYQARKPFEDEKKKRYNKRSVRNETESLFLQWENGSASVGEVKQFARFGKHHYYEKTAEGCVEITASQYAEKRGAYLGENYRRANNKIDAAAYHDEARKAGDIRDSGILGDNGTADVLSRQTVWETLRHDAGRSVPSVDRDSSGVSDSIDDTQHQQRTSPLTDREVLSIAASEVNVEGLTDGERDARAGAAAALFCSPPPCLSPDYAYKKCHGHTSI